MPGETLDANSVVAWTATDADGDNLEAHVHYSHDGRLRRSLAAYVPGASGQLPLTKYAGLPASESGVITVVVSDGWNTTTAVVDNLIVSPNRLPSVSISAPVSGASIPVGANVVLAGGAYDPEDAWLSGSALSWLSSRDGPLGTGEILNLNTLTMGAHIITLRAVDADGGQRATTVTVTIQ